MWYNFILWVLLLKNVKWINELRMKIERCFIEKKIDYYLNEIKVNCFKLIMINMRFYWKFNKDFLVFWW